MTTITRCIRVELVKPLDRTWDELGDRLRVLRLVSHRVMNAAVLDGAQRRRSKVKAKSGANALASIKAEMAEMATWAEGKRAKGEAGKRLEQLATLSLPSAVSDAMAQKATQTVMRWKGPNESLPQFKPGAPIFVRDGGWSLHETPEGMTLRVKLESKGHAEIAIAASKGAHWDGLRRIASGAEGTKPGDCKITYDERRKKWYGILSVTEPAPVAEMTTEHALVLRRGIRHMLYGLSTTGHDGVIFGGSDILAIKKQLGRRKREVKAHIREAGQGARGHGKARLFRGYHALEDTEARIIKTKCQQAAAAAVKYAQQRGCGVVYVEDWGGIVEDGRWSPRFPWAQLKAACEWACKRAGIEVREVDSGQVASTCPRCESPGRIAPRDDHVTFHCPACEFARRADFVAALNAARRTPHGAKTWDQRLARERDLVQKILTGTSEPVIAGAAE